MDFNEAISALALEEIPIKGRNFTWSNMQNAPLLEKLDWVFSSESWTTSYPNTLVIPLARPISDHIPKSSLFRFENFWLQHHDFMEVMENIWEQDVQEQDSAKRITAKFKRLRKGLKFWSKEKSQLAQSIKDANSVILFFDSIEEFRDLSQRESNGREIIKAHLQKLLSFQNTYWRQRATIRWAKFGEVNSKKFPFKSNNKLQEKHYFYSSR